MRLTCGSDGPARLASGGLRIAIRLTPKARADRVDGIATDAEGGIVLKVSVTAPPLDNRANAALLRLLAAEWHLPRRDLSLVSGAKSRHKIVHLAGEPAALLDRIKAALVALPQP